MPVIARPAVIDADFADGGVLDELLRHHPAHVTTDDLVRALVTSCEKPRMSATDVHDAVSRLIEAGLAYHGALRAHGGQLSGRARRPA